MTLLLLLLLLLVVVVVLLLFEGYGISEKSAYSSGPRIAILSEIEVISTETLTKDPNKFVLCVHKVCDLWKYHMENVLA
jgi:hypothetical protein